MKTATLLIPFALLLIGAASARAQIPPEEPVTTATAVTPAHAKRPPKVDWPSLPMPTLNGPSRPGQPWFITRVGSSARVALIKTFYALTPWQEKTTVPHLRPPTGTRRVYSGSLSED